MTVCLGTVGTSVNEIASNFMCSARCRSSPSGSASVVALTHATVVVMGASFGAGRVTVAGTPNARITALIATRASIELRVENDLDHRARPQAQAQRVLLRVHLGPL